ncbi:unnamed protein product [Agarophyton chilense]
MIRRFYVSLLLALALLVSVWGEEELDLQSMSSAQLSDLEKKLGGEVADRTKELDTIREDIKNLKDQQAAIDEEAQHLQGAKEWELKEKEKREKELVAAKNDVLAKQDSIARMSTQVASLKDHIQQFETRLQLLNQEKDSTEKRFHDPTLADVLESRSHNWGNVSRNLLNKTMTDVVPIFSDISETARTYRRQVSRTSKPLEVLTSLFIYAFMILAAVSVYRIYSKVKGKLTIARLLFLGDVFCACFWLVMLICFIVLFDDPLYVMKHRFSTAFFLFQLVACFSYINFVLLRVLVLASKMTLGALGETLGVVVEPRNFAEHNMFSVKKRALSARDIELTTVGVGATVCHGENTSPRMTEGPERFIFKSDFSIYGHAACAVAIDKVAPLYHEAFHNSVKKNIFVADWLAILPVFTSAKLAKILGCLGAYICEKFHCYTSNFFVSNFYVEEYDRILFIMVIKGIAHLNESRDPSEIPRRSYR